MADNKNYYEILGIERTATEDEVKKAFRKLSLQYHPDTQHDKTDEEKKIAEEKFKEISEAYATLSDREKREYYDNFVYASNFGGFGSGFNRGTRGSHAEDFFRSFQGGFGDFSFGGFGNDPGNPGNSRNSGIFGGWGSYQSGIYDPDSPRNGGDISTSVNISLEESIYGTTKTIPITVNEYCPECKGIGGKVITCPHCNGSGRIVDTIGMHSASMTCPMCRGSGKVPSPADKCHHCGGTGLVENDKKVEINIPAGVSYGTRFRCRNEGHKGINGGADGDVYIRVLFNNKSEMFVRDEFDLSTTVHISPETAILGGTVDVQTPYGVAEVAVEKGTISGQVLSLKNMGVKIGEILRGRLFVRIIVDSPTDLTDEQEERIREAFSTVSAENMKNVKSYMEKCKSFAERNKENIEKMKNDVANDGKI